MVKYAEAKHKILFKFKNSELLCSMQLKDGFLFSIKPKSTNDYVLDGFFKVTKNGAIEEYSPVMNPEEFKESFKHIIETR